MESVVNAVVVVAVGLVLGWFGKGRFQAIDRRFEAMDRRFDATDERIDRLEERLNQRMDGFQASLDAMRSDLTRVALAVGATPRADSG